MNTNEIAAHEYGAAVENPLTLWDIHWLKELDDEGFIDGLVESLWMFHSGDAEDAESTIERKHAARWCPASVISNEVRDLS